ncbi:hypothetical protein [Streptomyces sp. SBT349]|uniref:hypothetical protein n=1 Tax=Streptomyces sp. SBT349 TaxID=1580539 RepID=UPI00066D05F6|nr:hypothetical protein [Streptomyces sp. SBT349]
MTATGVLLAALCLPMAACVSFEGLSATEEEPEPYPVLPHGWQEAEDYAYTLEQGCEEETSSSWRITVTDTHQVAAESLDEPGRETPLADGPPPIEGLIRTAERGEAGVRIDYVLSGPEAGRPARITYDAEAGALAGLAEEGYEPCLRITDYRPAS